MVHVKRTGLVDPAAELEKLRKYRKHLLWIGGRYRLTGPEYRAALRAVKALDELAEQLTGDRELYWIKVRAEWGGLGRASELVT